MPGGAVRPEARPGRACALPSGDARKQLFLGKSHHSRNPCASRVREMERTRCDGYWRKIYGYEVLRETLTVHFPAIISSTRSSQVTPEKSHLRERNCPVPVYHTRHDPERRCTDFVGQNDRLDSKKAVCTGHRYPFEVSASFFTRLTSPRSCQDVRETISATPVFADYTQHDLVLEMIMFMPSMT
jgi:hypothetical protein